MWDLNYVAKRHGSSRDQKDASFLKHYTFYNNFEKKWSHDALNVIAAVHNAYWLNRYFQMTRLSYSHRFEDIYKNLINYTVLH